MIGIAINVALLPNLSRKIKEQDYVNVVNIQNLALEVGLILVIPATLALTVISYPIISTLFERGAFGEEQSLIVANALLFYSFGLPSYVLVKIMEPAFFARGDTKTPMKIAIICLISNVILNYIFYIFKLGYVGIILSSVISSYLNLTLLIKILIKKKHFYFKPDFFTKMVKIIIPAIFMALTLHLLKNYFADSEFFSKIIELGAFSPRHFPLPRGKCTFLKLEFLAYIKAHFTLSR
jgi:putative peptidoglycan lipid II flippase